MTASIQLRRFSIFLALLILLAGVAAEPNGELVCFL